MIMRPEEKETQLQIRCLVSNLYDLQKMRIAVGNRVVQSFYIQMGIEPGSKKETGDEESLAMIQKLKKEYDKVTELMIENKYTIKKQLSKLPKNVSLDYIKNELDYKMIEQYVNIMESEEETTKILKKYVQMHPMWDRFFKDVKGCGEVMAANCIAYLDIDKARHVSSFWKYCGIDTVLERDENGNALYVAPDNHDNKYRRKAVYEDEYGTIYTGKVETTGEFDENGEVIYFGTKGENLREIPQTKLVNGEMVEVYENIETGEEYIGEVMQLRHGRRMGDTEMREYIDKDGNVQVKKSLTYNPTLKSTLLGVLSSCILKVGQRFGYNKYEECYRESRNRLDQSPKYADKSSAHKHKMSVRFMTKEFLRDLWVEWRAYEGYEVTEPYEVAYLKRKPHKYNEAHVKKAEETKAR